MHFQDQDDAVSAAACVRSLSELATASEMEADEVYSAGVLYWLNKGVLKEVPMPLGSKAVQDYEEGVARYFQLIETQEALAAMDQSIDLDNNMQDQVIFFGLFFTVVFPIFSKIIPQFSNISPPSLLTHIRIQI